VNKKKNMPANRADVKSDVGNAVLVIYNLNSEENACKPT
jgi:hypothetical protein